MSKKITGDKEMDLIIAAVAKQFGRDCTYMGPTFEAAEPIPSGSTIFDSNTGIGGVPKDRVIEIYGPESSGKTSFCFQLAKEYDKAYPDDKRTKHVLEMERSIGGKLMRGFDLDPKEWVFHYPETAEECLEYLRALTASGLASIVLLDSIDALQSEATLKKSIGASDMKGISQMMGRTIREVAKHVVDKKVTVLLINQERDSMDMYGPKKRTSGGNAVPYYAAMRIKTMRQQESKDLPNAFNMRLQLIKNKCGAPHKKEIEIDFIYGKGVDPYFDLVKFAKEYGLIRLAGKLVAVKFSPDAEEEKVPCEAGAKGLRAYLVENPEFFDKLRKACLALGESMSNYNNLEQLDDGPSPEDE